MCTIFQTLQPKNASQIDGPPDDPAIGLASDQISSYSMTVRAVTSNRPKLQKPLSKKGGFLFSLLVHAFLLLFAYLFSNKSVEVRACYKMYNKQ